MAKQIVTEADVNKVIESGQKVLQCEEGACIITAQAQDKADLLGVKIEFVSAEQKAATSKVEAPAQEATVVKVEIPAQKDEQVSSASPKQTVAKPQSETDILISEVCGIIKSRLGNHVSEEVLFSIVHRVVSEKLSGAPATEATQEASQMCPGGVCVIEGQRLVKQGENHIAVDEQMFIADALGGCAGAELAAGYMEWANASFNRTVECAEIAVVVSGELQLTMANKTVNAKAGDMVYLPEGVDVTYATTSSVRLACINNVA